MKSKYLPFLSLTDRNMVVDVWNFILSDLSMKTFRNFVLFCYYGWLIRMWMNGINRKHLFYYVIFVSAPQFICYMNEDAKAWFERNLIESLH